MMRQRPLTVVPGPVRLLLAALLALQLLWGAQQAPARPRAQVLPPAPPAAAVRLASLGEPIAAAKLMMLYLQSHDDQPGAALPLHQLDYARVRDWLGRILELDPRAQYPLLAASQVYAAVGDPGRTRLMLDFVHQRFAEDPQRRWPWLAHAALVARHRLHDPALARRYAAAIRTSGAQVPPWARQLEIFILDDMNELDSARALAGAMLASGAVADPRELAFLEQRLRELEARARRSDR
jgi:hypothetical protein